MNPHEYDDEAFTKASNKFQHAATAGLEGLWKAGASAEDITSEINDALAEAGVGNQRGDGPLELMG